MKVCAHYNLGAFDQQYMRADSVKAALAEFRDGLVANYYGDLKGIVDRTGEDYAPTISFYPQCDDCNSNMCFHDYPMSRYQIGNRGGIRKVYC